MDGGLEGDDRCGQATVFDFVERFNLGPVEDVAPPPDAPGDFGFGDYESKPNAWALIWTYRRIKGKSEKPAVGDLSLQNWGYSRRLKQGGNDYPFGYLFKSRADTSAEVADWQGGIDRSVMAGAEVRALGWHAWFKAHAPEGIDPRQISLDIGVLGTGHGLAKLPYIRDTRRAVGLDGFVLKIDHLTGPVERKTGTPFPDRVALGAYPADIHPVLNCSFPAYINQGHETLPFFIPLRALTSDSYANLLVAGKTMAQSFLANAATRLHPIEWSSGTASGVVAATMARRGWTSRQALEHVTELQTLVRAQTPIDWTIDGVLHPGH